MRRACAAALVIILAAACGDEKVVRINEPFTIVDGTPRVDRGLPELEAAPPVFDPNAYTSNTPTQVDVFAQLTWRKTDILWVVDNTPSMQDEQDRLAQNFEAFIQYLTSADPPVDFHLGVITNDIDLLGAVLRPVPGVPGARWISCAVSAGVQTCTPAGAPAVIAAFKDMVKVGTTGIGIEHNLANLERALTPPLHAPSGDNDGFLRPDASLFIIDVSDEDDMSCAPLDLTGTSCRNVPRCGCKDESALTMGRATYYARFIEGIKGYGREDLITYAAIGAPNAKVLQAGPPEFRGCGDATNSGIWGKRREIVAAESGGIFVDICSTDYTTALGALGFAVSGLKTDFPLSRRPFDNTLQVRVTPPGATVGAALPRMTGTTQNWNYVMCESGRLLNAIRFYGNSIPEPNATIEVEYSVNVRGPSCP